MDNINVSPSDDFYKIYGSMNDKIYKNTNPLILLILVIILLIYFVLFSNLGETAPSANIESSGISIIEIIMWGLIVFLVLINGMQYFFQIDVDTALKNLFNVSIPLSDAVSAMFFAGSTPRTSQFRDWNAFRKVPSLLAISTTLGFSIFE